MPQTNTELIPKEMEKQNKDYCQLCYKGFGVFTFRYHCRPCGRSCCADCSLQVKVRMSVAVGQPSNYRVCEYCDIKAENPQVGASLISLIVRIVGGVLQARVLAEAVGLGGGRREDQVA